MIHEEVTLAGKPVNLGYCYATEIAYKDLSDENITDIIQDTITGINATPSRMPDAKRSIHLVLAAIIAYYESKGEDAPVKDSELINETSPMEVGKALGTVLSLRAEFYAVPAGEPEEKPAKGKGKAKN